MHKPLMPYDAALTALLARVGSPTATEWVPTMRAAGRMLADTLRSTIDVPSHDNTQMDGYAVVSADFADAATPVRLRVVQRIPAGQTGRPLLPGTAARIFTGASIPDGADAVVMQEQTSLDGDDVLVHHRPSAGEWIRRAGEDIRAGAPILSAGDRLTPQAVGLAASVGLARLPVHRSPRVACFFTGDELVMPGEPLPPGAIYNSNRFIIGALLRDLGCEVSDLGIVPDSLEATRAALRDAARDADLIVSSGGMSVGEEDHVRPAVQAEGGIEQWQIAIKPGKPLAYGHVRRADGGGAAHFIGLPGNPVSSFVTFLLFVRPFVLRLQGAAVTDPPAWTLRAGFDWSRPDRRREFLRVRLGDDGALQLFPNQGSAVLTSTVWADGLVDNPPGQAIARGDPVRFLPFGGLLR